MSAPLPPFPSLHLAAKSLAAQRGQRLLFAGLELQLQNGQALRITGANGSGKSSLLKILTTLLTPTEGSLLFNHRPLADCRAAYLAQLLYIGHADAATGDLSPFENLRFAAALAGMPGSTAQLDSALSAVGLQAVRDLASRQLSQGQRKRLSLARLFLPSNKALWLLDEPFAALDDGACQQVNAAISRHLAHGGALVYATHQEAQFEAEHLPSIALAAPSMLGAPC